MGADPGRPGGPWAFRSGRAPQSTGEVAVDAMLAARHVLDVGDSLPLLGRRLRVVGLTDDTGLFMTPLVFLTQKSLVELLRVPGTTGAVLVGTDDAGPTAARLTAAGLSVRTAPELHQASLRLATSVFAGPIRLMVGVGFAAWRPRFPVLLTVGTVSRTVLAAAAMAVLAAWVPARRVARLDAASAFRSER